MTLRLNQFCCCCTTRTGTLVIGTLGWILTLLQIFSAADPREQQQEHQLYNDQKHNTIYYKVGYGLVSLLICILLVVGVYKKDKRYLLPWLILKGLEGTLFAIVTVIVFFLACIYGVGILFGIFFVCVLASVLEWYFWLCVWSHYKDLTEEPDLAQQFTSIPKPANFA